MKRDFEIEKQIKDFFSNFKQFKSKTLENFFKENAKAKTYCDDILKNIPQYQSVSNFINCIVNDLKLPCCKTCGKLMTFSQINGRYCSRKCSSNDPENIEKGKIAFKKTCLSKFGVEAPLQNKEVKQKSKKTILEKYGVDNVAKSEEVRSKILNTMFERYGGHSSTNDEVKQKAKETNQRKYGR